MPQLLAAPVVKSAPLLSGSERISPSPFSVSPVSRPSGNAAGAAQMAPVRVLGVVKLRSLPRVSEAVKSRIRSAAS